MSKSKVCGQCKWGSGHRGDSIDCPNFSGCSICFSFNHNSRSCPSRAPPKERAPRKCGLCGLPGHNSSTCNASTEPQPRAGRIVSAPRDRQDDVDDDDDDENDDEYGDGDIGGGGHDSDSSRHGGGSPAGSDGGDDGASSDHSDEDAGPSDADVDAAALASARAAMYAKMKHIDDTNDIGPVSHETVNM